MGVAGDADFRQIDHSAVTAIGIVLGGKGQCAVPYLPPEAGGHDIFRAVVDVIAKVDSDWNTCAQQFRVLLRADGRGSARLNGNNGGNVVGGHIPADCTALRVGDENGLVAGQGLHVLHHLAQCGGSNCLIEVAGVGGHLAEELILCSIALRELGAFVPFRGNAANAEVGVPCLIAGLVVLGVGRPSIEETVRAHLGGTASLTTAGLVYQERRVAVAQKQIGPALTAVRGGYPAHAGLSIAVQINHRPTVAVCRDLIQNISVIHMSGVACTGSVQPVGGGIISACHRCRDRAAGGEHSLLGNRQRAVRVQIVLYPAAYLAVCLVNGNRSRCTRQCGSGCTTHHGGGKNFQKTFARDLIHLHLSFHLVHFPQKTLRTQLQTA